jgi:putative transposase
MLMPSKYYLRNFARGYYYHVYNRGANKEIVFRDHEDYNAFIEILAYYLTFPNGLPLSMLDNLKVKVPNLKKINTLASINLCVYCLMPNHFHLVFKQLTENDERTGITNLMRRLTITYSMYLQRKYSHSGAVFQGKFKNILVKKDSQLIQLSKYIHRNPLELLGSEPLNSYQYSSYKFYIGDELPPEWLNIHDILSYFSKPNIYNNYQNFTEDTPTDIKLIEDVGIE